MLQSTRWGGRVLGVVIWVGLWVIVYRVAWVGWADVASKTPIHDFHQWRSGQSVPDQSQLAVMRTALGDVHTMDPGNPNLLEMLGRMDAEMATKNGQSVRAYALRLQSLAWFEQALQQRPTSGYAWLNVALMKYQLGQVDAEFALALQQAQYRGPWEPPVQTGVIELGLASWPMLPKSTRAMIRQAIRTQSQWKRSNQQAVLLALLKRHQRTELICLLDPMMRACPAF